MKREIKFKCVICGTIKTIKTNLTLAPRTCGNKRCLSLINKYHQRVWRYKKNYSKEKFIKELKSKIFLTKCLKDAYKDKFGEEFNENRRE